MNLSVKIMWPDPAPINSEASTTLAFYLPIGVFIAGQQGPQGEQGPQGIQGPIGPAGNDADTTALREELLGTGGSAVSNGTYDGSTYHYTGGEIVQGGGVFGSIIDQAGAHSIELVVPDFQGSAQIIYFVNDTPSSLANPSTENLFYGSFALNQNTQLPTFMVVVYPDSGDPDVISRDVAVGDIISLTISNNNSTLTVNLNGTEIWSATTTKVLAETYTHLMFTKTVESDTIPDIQVSGLAAAAGTTGLIDTLIHDQVDPVIAGQVSIYQRLDTIEDVNTAQGIAISDLQAADAALATSILGRIANTEKGAANGVTPLDGGGKVPAAYLPSFVDDVLEYANLAAFPVSGETGKIYTALDTNKVYRWSGTVYVEISASPGSTDAVPEGVTNKYFTESRVLNTVLTGISFASNMAVLATDGVLTAFGKVQAQINDRLSNLSTPSATGIALSMAKSGTLGQIRALIAGQDIDVSATGADGVTISTVGRTLRYWAESLGVYGANAYRLFKPVRQVADGARRVSAMLGGLRSTDGATDYGVSFGNPDYTDHTGTLGAGSLDLQVRKSAAANLPSGTACVAIGQDNKVTGSRNVAISAINGATTVSGNDNYYMGPIIGNAVTGGDMNYSYGGTRIVGGYNKVFGGHDAGGGFYGTITGNHNIAMTGYSTVTGDGNVVIAPTAVHTASNGLILSSCPLFYGQSPRPRNMVAVSVRSSDRRINSSPGTQVVELYLGSMSGFNYDGSWNTLTSNGLAAGSTNVYIAGYDFFFTAYVTVFAPVGDLAGMFKFDGCVRNVGYSPTLIVNKTTLYHPDATKGDAQIVWSSGKLLIQVSATSGTGAQKLNGSAFLQCIEPGPAGGY